MDIKEYCELLVVSSGKEIHVVEAPAHEAYEGYLVVYCVDGAERIGTVTDKMWCVKDEEQYRCMAKMNRIFLAQAIYSKHWQAEVCKDKEQEE